MINRREFLKTAAMASGAMATAPLATWAAEAEAKSRPNVVIFFTDEMYPEIVGCYGGHDLTPNIDRLASEGVKFSQGYCTATGCTPSRFAALSGHYPGRCKHPGFAGSNPIDQPHNIGWNTWFTHETPTLPRMLKQAGYFTGMVGKWHVGGDPRDQYDWPKFDKQQGTLDDPATNRNMIEHQRMTAERIRAAGGWDRAINVMHANNGELPLKQLNFHHFEWHAAGAARFLEEASERDQPFLLYLATTAIHGPDHTKDAQADPTYTPGGKRDKPWENLPGRDTVQSRVEDAGRPYEHEAAGVVATDDVVGSVLRKLDALGMRDNTIVIFTSDHGIEPGKATCYERGTRVPFIMRWPGHIRPGTQSDVPVQHVDFVPTLLAAAGAKLPVGYKPDGVNILPAARGESTGREVVYFEMGTQRAIRKGKYKYIAFRYRKPDQQKMLAGEVDVALEQFGRVRQGHAQIAMGYYPAYFDPDQLYDLEADPYEQKNLADDPAYASVLTDMKRELGRKLATFERPYDLEDTAIFDEPKFKELVKARLDARTPGWWSEDYPWPPKGE